MLKKFLSIVFVFVVCLVNCSATKILVGTDHFSFIVNDTTNTAKLVQIKNVEDIVSIPEFVSYAGNNCNVVLIDENAFRNVLDKIKSVVLPKYLIKHEQNTNIIRILLDNNVEITQDGEVINRIEDFKPSPQLGKLRWEHDDYMLVDTSIKSDWRSLNRFMNGY